MRRIFLGISIASLACSLGALALAKPVDHPAAYDEFIATHAKKHGVPERLVHRILMRESRYDPRVFNKACYGLMQIKYGTARSMGYNGAPQGLFDPYVNMTYAIPYLANAYRVAGGDEDRAVALFAGGYYYAAKKNRMLASLRTADSPPLAPVPAAPPPQAPRNASADLFAFLQNSAPNTAEAAAQPPAQAAPPSALAYASSSAEPTPAQAANEATGSIDPAAKRHGAKTADEQTAKASQPKAAHASTAKTKTAVAMAEPSSRSPRPAVKAKVAKALDLSMASASPAKDAAKDAASAEQAASPGTTARQ